MSKDEIMKELKAIREDVRVIRSHMEGYEMTPEEERDVEEALKDVAEGRTVPHEQVVRDLQD